LGCKLLDLYPYSHIFTHIKTTIELPAPLLIAAKAVAVERRTTLKAILEHALRREITFQETPTPRDIFEINQYDFPVLKRRKAPQVTSAMIYRKMEEEDL
jgi:hypothetical protein